MREMFYMYNEVESILFSKSMATKAEKEEKTERFIGEWREIRCLWDITSVEYRDRNEKRI